MKIFEDILSMFFKVFGIILITAGLLQFVFQMLVIAHIIKM